MPRADGRAAGRSARASTANERDERRRVELGRERNAEQGEGKRVAAPEQRGQCAGDEQGRERVVGVQRDRPDHERRQRDGEDAGVKPSGACTEPRQDQPDDDQRRQADERHGHLECVEIPAVGQQRRRREDEKAARRVLDEEVPVGDAPVQQRLRVIAVEPDVAEPPLTEEPAGRDRRRNQVDRRGERGRPQCPAQLGGRSSCRRRAAYASEGRRRRPLPRAAGVAQPAAEAAAAPALPPRSGGGA